MVQLLDKYGKSSIDDGKVIVLDKYGKVKSFSSGGGSGTVTSFSSGNLSPLFNTSVANPTTTPILSFSQISQTQNLFYASPNGSSGVPTFRAILASDLPSLSGTYVPYTGATQDVDLGEYELKAGQIEFDQTPTGTAGTAIMRWNDQDGTVDLGLKGGNVTLQIGQEEVILVVNKTGINLLESNYQVTRIRTVAEGGAQGQRLAVVLAQANTKANHTGVLGIVTENINNNQEGFITTFGMVRNIDTTGSLQGETWVDGDVLWLSETVAGGLTNIEPTTHPVQIGYVVYAHNNNGKIFVKVSEGVDELGELHDVNLSSPTDNQVLAYTSSTQLWENKNVNTVIGYTPLPTQAGSTTGTVVTFVTDRVYGTIASPETGNITADVTGAQVGVTNIIIHNSGTAPTFGVEFKKLSGSGNYITSQVNYIYCTFINSTEIIYSINQRT